MLRALDIVVLLKVHVLGEPSRGQMQIASLLGISSRSVNEALKRGAASKLYSPDRRQLNLAAMEDMLLHGLRYFLPAERGTLTRGMPTAWATPPLSNLMATSQEPPPVWPHPEGELRGIGFIPLHPCVPAAAKQDACLYEFLAIVDALRGGTAREMALAGDELRGRLRK